MSLSSAVKVRASAARNRSQRGASRDTQRPLTSDSRLTVVIAGEDSFTSALHLERKRTERSRGRFVLMLVTGPILSRGVSPAADAISTALTRSIRETDIIGWFKAGAEISVIFTDVGESEEQIVINALRERVTTLLGTVLPVEELPGIRLEFHSYPERWDGQGQDPEDLAALYPDLERKRKNGRAAHLMKRILDITGSVLALIFLAPLFLAIAIAVRLGSRGPVLFSTGAGRSRRQEDSPS